MKIKIFLKVVFLGIVNWGQRRKFTKIMEALVVRGTQIKNKNKRIKDPHHKTHKHKFLLILQLGKENGENIISQPNSSTFPFQTQ